MKKLEEVKKDIHFIYEYASEAENYQDFGYISSAISLIAETLETIIDNLIKDQQK